MLYLIFSSLGTCLIIHLVGLRLVSWPIYALHWSTIISLPLWPLNSGIISICTLWRLTYTMSSVTMSYTVSSRTMSREWKRHWPKVKFQNIFNFTLFGKIRLGRRGRRFGGYRSAKSIGWYLRVGSGCNISRFKHGPCHCLARLSSDVKVNGIDSDIFIGFVSNEVHVV